MARKTIYDISQTDASNTLAQTGLAASDTMNPSAVDDTLRGSMAFIAEMLADTTATTAPGTANDAGGTANALTLTANASFTTLAQGRKISWRATANNTGPAVMNANGTGSKAIRYQTGSGDAALYANAMAAGGLYTGIYDTASDSGSGAWILLNPNPSDAGLDANLTRYAAGTQPAFRAYQSSQVNLVDTEWTKLTFSAENYDTTSDFASNRFTPSVPGYYDIEGQIAGVLQASQNRYTLDLAIRKNGSGASISRWEDPTGDAQRFGVSVRDRLHLNGTTDYVELFYYWTQPGSGAYNPDNNYITAGSVYNMFSGALFLPT